MNIKFYRIPFLPLLKDVERADELFICTASISENVIFQIHNRAREDCKKTLVLGCFGENFHTAAFPNWKIYAHPELHAKVVVLKIKDRYIIYIGSSNLSASGSLGFLLEMNIRLEVAKLPSELKQFIKDAKSY